MARKAKVVEAAPAPEADKITELGIIYSGGQRSGYKIGKPEGQAFEVLNILGQTGSYLIDLKWEDNRVTRVEFIKSNLAGWDFTVG